MKLQQDVAQNVYFIVVSQETLISKRYVWGMLFDYDGRIYSLKIDRPSKESRIKLWLLEGRCHQMWLIEKKSWEPLY